MNAIPGSEPLGILAEAWDIISSMEPSFPSEEAERCIDYVFHLKGTAPVKILGSHTMTQFQDADASVASDHLPVFVDVKIIKKRRK